MRLLNPRLEPLRVGGTLVTCEVRMDAGREALTRELRFTVRLEPAAVEHLLTEAGPERAIWSLWTYFRRITPAPMAVDSEQASLQDWANAIDTILLEVKPATGTRLDQAAG